MTHLSDDDLVLHYYGEDGPRIVTIERHLGTCSQCAGAYEKLALTLNAVTPPEVVEDGDIPSFGDLLRDRLRNQAVTVPASATPSSREAGWIAAVWLVPLVYPFALRALFDSAQWSRGHAVGVGFIALTLMWACAGPVIAASALKQMGTESLERAPTRLLVCGALMAAISPALFLFLSHVQPGLPYWYAVILLTSLPAVFRWRRVRRSSALWVRVHRLSALVLGVFVLAHIFNQALAFVSIASYAAMRSVMRVASQEPVTYALLVGAVTIQIVTGAATAMKHVGARPSARNLQAVSGWYLGAFMLTHVLSGLLLRQPAAARTVATSASQFNLLATPGAAAQLPFLLLGVAALLFHVGVYARLAALAYLAEAQVRRLSYAGALVGTTIVVSIGLALCGVHLIR